MGGSAGAPVVYRRMLDNLYHRVRGNGFLESEGVAVPPADAFLEDPFDGADLSRLQTRKVDLRRAVAEGDAGESKMPSLVPKEVKVDKPITFSGKHHELQNFLFVMKQYVDIVGLGNGRRAC